MDWQQIPTNHGKQVASQPSADLIWGAQLLPSCLLCFREVVSYRPGFFSRPRCFAYRPSIPSLNAEQNLAFITEREWAPSLLREERAYCKKIAGGRNLERAARALLSANAGERRLPVTPGQPAALRLQMLASIFGELWKRLYYSMLFSGTPSKEKPLRLLFWLSDAGVLLECLYYFFFP